VEKNLIILAIHRDQMNALFLQKSGFHNIKKIQDTFSGNYTSNMFKKQENFGKDCGRESMMN